LLVIATLVLALIEAGLVIATIIVAFTTGGSAAIVMAITAGMRATIWTHPVGATTMGAIEVRTVKLLTVKVRASAPRSITTVMDGRHGATIIATVSIESLAGWHTAVFRAAHVRTSHPPTFHVVPVFARAIPARGAIVEAFAAILHSLALVVHAPLHAFLEAFALFGGEGFESFTHVVTHVVRSLGTRTGATAFNFRAAACIAVIASISAFARITSRGILAARGLEALFIAAIIIVAAALIRGLANGAC
jgi:hypothetical protein